MATPTPSQKTSGQEDGINIEVHLELSSAFIESVFVIERDSPQEDVLRRGCKHLKRSPAAFD